MRPKQQQTQPVTNQQTGAKEQGNVGVIMGLYISCIFDNLFYNAKFTRAYYCAETMITSHRQKRSCIQIINK